MNYLALDIGGTALKIAIVNENGKILISDKYPVNFDNYKTPIIDTVLKETDKFLADNKIESFKGVAVSATGQIDVNKGEVIGTGGNIKNYEGSKFKEKIEEKYKVKATVINDANAAALGELFLGNGKNSKNIVMITIGTGVGGGIVVNGEILNGRLGIGGELGHFSINNKGKKCTCGNTGCYEQYASMSALIKRVKEELDINDINGKEIFEQINHNEKMKEIVDRWIEDVACGVVSLVHIFNPDIVLIGGAVSEQKELFIDKLRKLVKERVMKNFAKDLKVEPAKLKNDAGIIGALYYLLKGENKDELQYGEI